MYEKYFVYIDDGEHVFKVAVPEVSEEAAIAQCEGAGEIVAVKKVTDEFHIESDKVRMALKDWGFEGYEIDFITRALNYIGVTTE